VLNALQPVAALAARLYVAQVFFLSGLTKLRDWGTTVALFTDEYKVPLLSPLVAALMGTAGELVLPHAAGAGPGRALCGAGAVCGECGGRHRIDRYCARRAAAAHPVGCAAGGAGGVRAGRLVAGPGADAGPEALTS
jgi:hypothetical protein